MAEDKFQQQKRFRGFEKDVLSIIIQTQHLKNNPDMQQNLKSNENHKALGKPTSQLSENRLEHPRKRQDRQRD